MDDNNLAKRAAEGDNSAFELLVKQYETRVYSMTYRMTGSHEDASDLSQEAFIRVWRALSGFKGEARFSTWLYRIVSNLCADYGRKKSRRNEKSLSDEDEKEKLIPDERFEPERLLEQKETKRSIIKAVENLSFEHREIFIMREVYGLSYADIAESLDIEEGTVKSRLFRARENLREYLSVHGNISGGDSSKSTKGGARQ